VAASAAILIDFLSKQRCLYKIPNSASAVAFCIWLLLFLATQLIPLAEFHLI
jgi:hypothetical protein